MTGLSRPVEPSSKESRVLRVLNLEESPLDTERLRSHMAEGGIDCEMVRVQTRAEFAAALEDGGFDLILAGYAVPSFHGLSALELAREFRPEVPFILVSERIGEDAAIESIKSGVTDYVLKHRLERLVPAVRRAIRESQERRERARAEEALQRSEQQFRALVEQIPAVTYTQLIAEPGKSKTKPTVYVSPQIEALSGHPPQSFVEDPELWIRLLHPEDCERVLAEDRRTDQSGESFRMDYRLISRDGQVLWIRDEAVLMRGEDGRPRYWKGVKYDITERKQTEKALLESEVQYRALVQYGSDIVTILEADGTVRYQSPSIERVLGYTSEELVGENAFKNIHPEDIEPALCAFAEVLSERGATVRAEFRFRHADGSWRYIEGIGNNLVDDPSMRGIVVTSRDVTERKEAEENLREAERRYRTLIEQIPAITYVREPGEPSRTTYISPQVETVLGYSPQESLSDPDHWIEIMHPADRERVLAEDRRTNETGEPFSMEYRQSAKDGRVVWIRDEATLVRDEEASPSYWLGVQTDITEHKRAEERLQEAEARYRSLVEEMPAVIYIQKTEHKGAIAYISPQIEDIMGYSPQEYIDDPNLWVKTTYPEDLEMLLAEDRRTDESGEPFRVEYRKLTRDGRVIWVRDEAVLVKTPEGRPLYWQGIFANVTERKRTERALRESEHRFRQLFEQSVDALFVHDEEGRLVDCNAQACQSLGYTREELLKLSVKDFATNLLSEEENKAMRGNTLWEQAVRGEPGRIVGFDENELRRKDGTTFPVEVGVSAIDYSGRSLILASARDLTERKRAEGNLRRSLSALLALREASQVLGSTLSSEEIVSRLLEIMRGVSHLVAAVISVRGEDGELRIWRSAGLEGLRRRARFKQEAEAARRAALEEEDQQLFRLHGSGVEEDYLVGLCLPLRAKDRVVGVLEAYGRESLADNDTMEILSSLASQAASALENARLYEQLAEREHALQDLVGKLLRAQEEERRRVAYEVHDGLAQVAVSAHQHLQAFARRHSPGTERGQSDLERILRLVRLTVTDARRIIANLRPTALDDLGLAAALALEVETLREDGYQVTYEENLDDERLPDTVEITLFRVAQEALTNVRKHAQTRQVRIRLRRSRDEVYVEVQDYGRGFDPGLASGESGPGERIGLAGMRERVVALGGDLKIHSRPDAGTFIAATVPLTQSP